MDDDMDDMDDMPSKPVDMETIIATDNLCDVLDEKFLKSLGSDVVEDFDRDLSFFVNGRKVLIDQYISDCDMNVKAKSYPFDGASNIKYPLLEMAVMNFVSNALPMIWHDGKVAKFEVIGKDYPINAVPQEGQDGEQLSGFKEMKANRVSTVLNYHIKKQGLFNVLDRGLYVQGVCGYFVLKTSWDHGENAPVFKCLMPSEVIVDSSADDFDNCSRITEEIKYYPHQIEELIRLSLFRDFNYKGEETGSEDEEMGQDDRDFNNNDDDQEPHLFLQQHRLVDLDRDGYAEPYIVTVHKATEKVVQIEKSFNEDSIYRNTDKEIVKIEKIKNYVQIPMLPDMNGTVYARGLGDLLSMLQTAISKSSNMSMDAMHLSLAGNGLMLKSLKVLGGDLKLNPFQFLKVDGTAEQLQGGIREMPRPQPNPVMLSFMEMLLKGSESLMILKRLDLESLPANMPATTTMAAIEQGMTVFKAVLKRIFNGLDKFLNILIEQYKNNIDFERFISETGIELLQEDFAGNDYSICPAADPDVSSNHQKFMQAQTLQGMLGDPYIDPMEARRLILKTIGLSAEKLIVQPPQPQPDPMAEAQAKVLNAQAMSFEIDNQIKQLKVQSDADKQMLDNQLTDAKIVKELSGAVKNIADAEAAEEGSQIAQYETIVKGLGNGTSERA